MKQGGNKGWVDTQKEMLSYAAIDVYSIVRCYMRITTICV